MTKYDYSMLLSFSPEYAHLRDSTKTELFNEFLIKMRRMYPQMRYIAIPSVTPNGHLHFHLFIGGITPQDIRSVSIRDPSKNTYYYVDDWTYGYGVMSPLYKVVIA